MQISTSKEGTGLEAFHFIGEHELVCHIVSLRVIFTTIPSAHPLEVAVGPRFSVVQGHEPPGATKHLGNQEETDTLGAKGRSHGPEETGKHTTKGRNTPKENELEMTSDEMTCSPCSHERHNLGDHDHNQCASHILDLKQFVADEAERIFST